MKNPSRTLLPIAIVTLGLLTMLSFIIAGIVYSQDPTIGHTITLFIPFSLFLLTLALSVIFEIQHDRYQRYIQQRYEHRRQAWEDIRAEAQLNALESQSPER